MTDKTSENNIEILPLDHKVWKKLVSGEINIEFEFIAIARLLYQLKARVDNEHQPEIIEETARELRTFFVKTKNLPTVQKDLKKLLIISEIWS